MIRGHQEYLIDENGKKKAVVVPFDEWKKIREALEELDDIRAYDKAKSKLSDHVLFDEAVEQIRKRKSR